MVVSLLESDTAEERKMEKGSDALGQQDKSRSRTLRDPNSTHQYLKSLEYAGKRTEGNAYGTRSKSATRYIFGSYLSDH